MSPARTAFFDELAPRWDDLSGVESIARIEQWCSSLPLPVEGVILDLGCGTGVSSRALAGSPVSAGAGRNIFALDLSLEMVREGRSKRDDERIGWLCGDAELLPLTDASVRAIVALHMLPHIENQKLAFGEWRRVLVRGGSLFIAHLSSRARINGIHRSGPDVIREDRLPPVGIMAERVATSGFAVLETEDSDERYCLHCARL
jgi:ubiquinone/menaquinone biosynthesis C-methylase UbiE